MTDLVERDPELAEIDSFVRRGGVMLIEAGAGVGKTSLLEAACAIARRERRIVLRARGSDLESDFPFGIARQLFERRCADATTDERNALLAGPARPVEGHLARAYGKLGIAGREQLDRVLGPQKTRVSTL